MIKKLLNIIFGLVAVFMPLNSAHADLWYPSANRLTPVSPAWGLKVPAITTGGGTECLQISSTGVFSAAGAGCLTTSSLSSPLGTINVSGGEIDVNTSFAFDWFADHRWQGLSAIVTGNTDTPLSNGFVLRNSDSNNPPYLRFESASSDFYVGFIAPNFEVSSPTVLWTLPEQDASGVWKSDGAGFMSIDKVILTTGQDLAGVLPPDFGGTGTTTVFTAGSMIFAGASGVYTEDNANFFIDDTNNRVGFGLNNPSYKLHVSGGDSITGYFTSSAGSTRLGVNNSANSGIGFYIGGTLRWSQAVVNGGGGGTNPDLVFYNDQTSTNAIWLDGNNNNVSFGVVAPSTTNKFHVESTYSTSASRIAYFKGTSGTSGLEVRTNGNAQYMARSSTHANSELRFQQYSDGNAYFGTVTMSGTLTSDLYIRNSADSGTNNGVIRFRPTTIAYDAVVFDGTVANPKVTITQATVGNEVMRIQSTATNDDPSERLFQNRVATTDATVTTLGTFTISATTTYTIETTVTARRTGGASGTAEDSASYQIIATFKNVAGTATQVGATTVVHTAEDQAGWDCVYDVTAGTARVRVTGAASNNVTWHATTRTYQLSS